MIKRFATFGLLAFALVMLTNVATAEAKCACARKYSGCILKLKPGQAAAKLVECDNAFNECVKACTEKRECKKACREAKRDGVAACKKAFADEVCGMKDRECKRKARADRATCKKAARKDKRGCTQTCKE